MRYSAVLRPLLFLAVFAFPRVSAADTAAPFTVFVSALHGADTPHCGAVQAPCKTFQAGVNRAVAGGSVVAVDSGTYGAVIVTKGVTIEAPAGVSAVIETVSGVGVNIEAGANDTVVLRGLTLVSQTNLQGSIDGIRVGSAGSVHVEKCVIDGYAMGIFANVLAPVLLIVNATLIRGSGGPAVNIASVTSTIHASFDQCHFDGNLDGLVLQGNGTAVARNSSFSGNQIVGAAASAGPSGTSVELNLENCVMANNGDSGVYSSGRNGGSATVRISNCTIVDDATGVLAIGGGVVLSRGNNTIEGNGIDVSGTLGTYAAK